ncbi:MAG: Smr/MutS family protein [Bacteroidota bacterium]
MPEIDLHPADAETRLGFHLVRARLTANARTPYGRERLDALRPQSSAEAVRPALLRAGEMREAFASGVPVPVRQAAEVRPILRRLGPEGAVASGEDLADVRHVLETLRTLHDDLLARRETAPALWAEARRITVLKALEDRIARAIDEDGSVRDDASPELQRLSRQIASLEGQVRAAVQSALRAAAAEGWAAEDQPTIRGGRAVIPIRAEAKRKVDGFVQDVSGSGQTFYVEPTRAVEINNEIRELQIARGREIERILADLSGHLRHHRRDVEQGLGALAILDEAFAAGRLAQDLDALVPEIAESGPMRLVKARNPALVLHIRAGASRIRRETGRAPEPREVVPLDLTLGEEAQGEATHTLIVTGPNAGGKSVALKTVGLFALMAGCGLPVPAAPGTRVVLPTRLFVDVGDRQSIEDDLSTFTSHLVLMKRVLEEADDRSLVLMDEAGTGTDPAEGGAIAKAVLRRLTQRRALTLATTHIGELKAFAHDTPGAENAAMEFSRERLEPTYRFQSGVPGSSYAFEIARRVGLDAPVIAEARETVGEGMARLEDLLAEAEARSEAAERVRQEAEEQLAKADRVRADYEQRLDKHRAERDAIKAAALADAEKVLKDANAAVERAVREIKEAEAEKEATALARAELEEKKQAVARRARNVSKRQKRRAPATNGRAQSARLGAEAEGPIQVGDQVRLDDAGAVGEVIELTDKEAVVALGALTSRVKLKRLTKVGGAKQQTVIVGGPAASDPLPITRARRKVDLRGQRVEAALPEVERLVDEGLAAGLPAVEILHGKGTGALRQAIHNQLARRRDVAGFEAAEWDQGGDGVTIVRLG